MSEPRTAEPEARYRALPECLSWKQGACDPGIYLLATELTDSVRQCSRIFIIL